MARSVDSGNSSLLRMRVSTRLILLQMQPALAITTTNTECSRNISSTRRSADFKCETKQAGAQKHPLLRLACHLPRGRPTLHERSNEGLYRLPACKRLLVSPEKRHLIANCWLIECLHVSHIATPGKKTCYRAKIRPMARSVGMKLYCCYTNKSASLLHPLPHVGV